MGQIERWIDRGHPLFREAAAYAFILELSVVNGWILEVMSHHEASGGVGGGPGGGGM